jgi:YVTN family beta-propeller protein
MVPVAARAADGGIHLYLQPLSGEAARLTFALGSMAAVSESGAEYPLKLALTVIGAPEAGRQRLLASGRLPNGSYTGFVLTIKKATLKSDRGEGALVVPDAPVRLHFPFSAARRQASLAWLTLKYEDSVTGAFEFRPVFSIVVPSRPIADHAGFVSNSGSDTITVFDKTIMQAVAVIEACAAPAGMALDQPRRRLYVACEADDEILSIDVTTGEVAERTRVSPGDRPKEVALTPDGRTLVTVNSGSNSVSFFDAFSLARQERISVGSGPASVAVEPTGRRAFVFNTLSSSVSVIDVASGSVATTISTDSAPLRGQFNRRGDRLYVIHERSPYMTVLDPRQLTIMTRARLRIGIAALAIDTVRDLVCVGGGEDTTVDFYDPNALMPIYSLRTTAGVSYLAVDAEDNNLYMVNRDTRTVAVAHLANRKLASEIDVGERPYWLSVMGEK